MTPSDWAAWVQAIGSVAGIAVAIWVPWKIHRSEQQAIQRAKDAYKSLLRDAFKNLRAPIVHLDAISDFSYDLVSPLPGTRSPQRADSGLPEETASQLSSAIEKMSDVLVVIREIEDVKRLDDFNSILAILDLRRKIEAAVPEFEKELAWLHDHGNSRAVVSNAIKKLGAHTFELRSGIDRVLDAL